MTSGQGLCDIPNLWLDVTRLLSRVGRGALTGIDRVELAYLEAALDGPARYFCRTTRGFLLLDRVGGQRLFDMVSGGAPLAQADWLSRLTGRGQRPRHRAEAALRAHAIARCTKGRLSAFLRRHGAPGITYLNVGHSNLSEATLSAFAAHPGTLGVLIHDIIPITHPEYVVEGQPEVFAGRMDRVRRHADLVIGNSAATLDDLRTHWAGRDMPTRLIAAHLGVTPRSVPQNVHRDPGHFVMLGTVEARKNHALMVETWDILAAQLEDAEMPKLHIIGAVGWKVEKMMAHLRAHPLLDRHIFLHGPLPDTAVAEHLTRANALLFPSIAEGYGYPPLEAAQAGATPICSDLSVFRETLGDCAVYVDSPGAYPWSETIKQHFRGTAVKPELTMLKVPTWAEHFDTVAEAIQPTSRKGRP